VLDRGYSITLGPDGATLSGPEGLSEGDEIVTRLARGQVGSRVMYAKVASEVPVEEGNSDA